MPVNITGAKYAIRPISAVGTTTVTIATATFVSGDFGATQRMVALYTSAGAFKGIAWVRRFVSTTQIELENQFVDPVTGLYVTQTVGDTVLVSKNSVESAGAGFDVSSIPQQVAVTDLVTFGTAGNQTAVCFYEENTDFHTTNCMQVLGGVVVFGKLISYDGTGRGSFIWSRECNVKPRSDYSGGGAGSVSYNVFATGGTSAHMFFFGGMVGGSFRATNFIGAQASNATNATFAFFGTRLFYAVMSPGTGGNWASKPERHLLYKTIHESNYSNASLITWGNGAFQGQYLAFPQFDAAIPLGMFRASTTAYFGATAGERTIISDLGRGSLIDGLNGGDYRFVNLITPAVTRVRGSASIPIEMRFSDEYTNLKPSSTVVVQRTTDGVIADSVVNTSSDKFAASVIQATYAGTTSPVPQTSNHTSFGYTVKSYGFRVVSGVHSAYTYPLGTAGSGTDLRLGGLINQVVDTGVTLNETQALALGSKFSIDIPNKRITVLSNSTLSELMDCTVAWGCSSAANAVVPSLNSYLFNYNGPRLVGFTDWSLTINNGVTLDLDSKYKELELTGTGKVTVNGTITMPYSDVDGLRVTVTNLDPEGFGVTWYLRHKPKASGTWTNISGTGNTSLILLASGSYDVQVRTPGYDWESNLSLDTNESLILNAGLRYQVSANNTPQYTMPFDSVLEAIFQYDPIEMKVSVTNETGNIIQPGFAELYQATQRIQHISGLVWSWTSPVTANSTSQKILIPNGNSISMYLTDDSDASVKITCPVIHADTAESADDRVRGNSAGYSIILGSPATAESAGLASQIVGSLGGSGYTEALASQMRLKELIDDLQSLVQEVKSRTDVIPDDPATSSEVQDIKDKVDTLENTDISSLATSEQVLALGTPLQEADYVEPDNTSISEIKTKVLTLENAPSADTIADSVWNEVLTGNTHNVNRSAGKRLRTLADTVILIEGIATDMSNPGNGTGTVVLTDATTVCIKQAIRIGDQVRYVRSFDPVTKVAVTDRPWCTVLTGNQDYTVFNGRESDPVGAVTVTDLEVIKGQGFDTNKHSLVKIKKETSLAVALSA